MGCFPPNVRAEGTIKTPHSSYKNGFSVKNLHFYVNKKHFFNTKPNKILIFEQK